MARWAVDLSDRLEAVSPGEDPLLAVLAAIEQVLPGDSVGLVTIDTSARRATIRARPGPSVSPDIAAALSSCLSDHPKYASYSGNPLEIHPRRISDLVPDRAWRSHRVFNELFRPMGAVHQLSIPLAPWSSERGGVNWVINRSDSDFLDAEVEIAQSMQSALIMLRVLYSDRWRSRSGTSSSRLLEQLTPRERHVLALTAQGLTAQATGRTLGISPRTVSKHLEHAYNKIGIHDRMLAAREVWQLVVPEMATAGRDLGDQQLTQVASVVTQPIGATSP